MKVAAQFVITAGVLAYLFHIVPLGEIWRVMLSAHPGYVALGFLLQMTIRLPTAIRMKVIADAQQLALSLRTILMTLFSTSFYGLLLPGALAGGAASWMKYVQHGVKPGPALVSIVVNRSTELLASIMAGICYWIMDRWLDGPAVLLVPPLGVCALLVVYLLLYGRSHYMSVVVEYGARLPWLRENALYRKLRGFAEQLARMRELPRRAILTILAASLVQDIVGAIAIYSFAHALGLELDFLTVAWMRVAVHIAVMLPVSVSGLGVREGLLVLLTAPYDVAASQAIAWSFLIFSGTLLAAAGGGLIEGYTLWSARHPGAARKRNADGF